MTDELVERLLDWPYQGETMAHEAAERIVTLTAERDVSNELGKALEEDAGQLRAERDRLRAALIELIQQTHNCERELTEDLHHVDFCGESVPLTNAREALKKAT